MKTAVADTSIDSFKNDVLPTLDNRQRCVYELLERTSDLTNSEIARELDWPINCVTPRIFELRVMKLVMEYGKRKCRVTGKTVKSWGIISNSLF